MTNRSTSHSDAPPEAWPPAQRMAVKVLGPIERILHVEAASGVALLIATAIALAWANSHWGPSYEHLWHTPISIGVGSFRAEQSLHFLINEALMTVFFFVVGLEIRREIHAGELADLRRATLPLAAALGGMAVPALVYLALRPPVEVRQAWGVPMATDIAFAVGVLALLGKRVPAALRVLLLALAIIDDIGAIIVIAVFYSSAIDLRGAALAIGGLLSVLVLQRFGVRRAVLYIPSGVALWFGLLWGGLHPTLAGVAMGLLTPARSWFGTSGFVAAARDAIEKVRVRAEERTSQDDLASPLADLGVAQREALPPTVRLQLLIHPWVAFAIMPLFAFANAGVVLDAQALADPAARAAAFGIAAGLVVGKPVGVLLACFAVVKLGLCNLPRGVSWAGVAVVGCVAGIGFTMAIFIAGLAFSAPALLAAAKLGILVASGAAALFGLILGVVTLPGVPHAEAAKTASDAERSADV